MKFINLLESRLQSINEHTFIIEENKQYNILDLGSCRGDFHKKCIEIIGEQNISKYVGVEANPSLYSKYLENIQTENYQFICKAITKSNDDSIYFYDIPTDKECGNTFGTVEFLYKSAPDVIKVMTTTISQVINQFKFDKIDILKVDIEGREYDMIETIDYELAPKIDQISIEFHDFVDPSFKQLNESAFQKLSELGFKMIYNRPQYVWHDTQYYDTLFVNVSN